MTLTATPPRRPAPAPTPLRVAGPRSRRAPWVALSVVLVATGALVFAMLVRSAGERRAVVVTARALAPGQVVERADLAVVDVAVDAPLALVPATRLGSLVGKRAITALPAGSVLAPGHLAAGSGLEAGQVVVGALLGPGGLPVANLRAGDRVRLLSAAPPGLAAPAEEAASGAVVAAATVYQVSPGPQTGSKFVSLVVDDSSAQAVADAAAAQRLRVVLEGGPR